MSDAPSAAPGYVVRRATTEDHGAVLALWAESFEVLRGDAGARKLAWEYIDNPAGEGLLFVLEDGSGQVVGAQGIGRRAFACGGRTIRGGIMAEFVVAPKHRSLGPAIQLLEGANRASADEVEFLYGFPNRSAEAVFKRVGYRKLGRLTRYSKLLRSRSFLGRRIPPWCAALLAQFVDVALYARDLLDRLRVGRKYRWIAEDVLDDRFDRLWERGSQLGRLASARSWRALEWRFEKSPYRIRMTTASDPEGGELVGYVAWDVVDGTARVRDFFATTDVIRLLRYATWEARRAGCESLTVEFDGTADARALVVAAGLSEREDSPIYCVTRPGFADVADAAAHFTGYDRDG